MSLSELHFDNADQLNQTFSNRIVELLRTSLEQKGKASLVVSGGRTPVSLFEVLSTQELDWSKVTITLADERWVNEDHSDSNANLVKSHLLVNKAASATFVSLKTAGDNPYSEESAVASQLESVAQPFTVTILGMGEDGHTASLFPCSEELSKGIDLNNQASCLAVTPTTAPHKRMSLTLNAIVQSENVFLHLTGENKKTVLHKAIADTNQPKPIVSVVNNADVTLYWAP